MSHMSGGGNNNSGDESTPVDPRTNEQEGGGNEAASLEFLAQSSQPQPQPLGMSFLPKASEKKDHSYEFLPRAHDLFDPDPENGIWYGEPFRVVVSNRALKNKETLYGRGVTDIHNIMHPWQSRQLMLNHANPHTVFFPLWVASIKEVTSTPAEHPEWSTITMEQLMEAHKLLQGDTLRNNWGISGELRKINQHLPDYLYYVLGIQEDRHGLNSFQRAVANMDSTGFWQKMDLDGVFRKDKMSYLRGGMESIIERRAYYDGIIPAEDPEKGTFSVSYKDPKTGKITELVSGTSVKSKKGEDYKLSIKLGPDLTDEQFAHALRHAMVVAAQYAQFSGHNRLPLKWSSNPDHNCLIISMALEYGFHIPAEMFVSPPARNVVQQIEDKYKNDPDRMDLMLDFWNKHKERAQMMMPNFVGETRHIDNKEVARNPNLAFHGTKKVVIDPLATKRHWHKRVLVEKGPAISFRDSIVEMRQDAAKNGLFGNDMKDLFKHLPTKAGPQPGQP